MSPKKDDLKSKDEKPTQAEFGQTVSALAKHGITGQALVTAIGLSKDKPRRDNAEALKAYFRSSPKAKVVEVKPEKEK